MTCGGAGEWDNISVRPQPLVDLFDDYDDSSTESRTDTPFLCETRNRLSLHFDNANVQSMMDPADPTRLMLGYTRTMMNFRDFQPNPRHIGMVGLGGGSLPKHCFRLLPRSRITVAEISPEVIGLRHTFLIPPDSRRFRVVCENGADFVRRYPASFDVLLIDGFDREGQPPELCSLEFYVHCREALTPDGVLVVNICDSGRSMLIPRLRRAFHRQVLVAEGESSDNTIVFAGHLTPPRSHRPKPKIRASR